MPEVGNITEITSAPQSQSWIWTIDDFLSMPKHTGYAIGSPKFSFGESSWRMMAFPNGTKELLGCTILSLSVAASYIGTIHWEMGIYRQDGKLLKKSCGVRTYQGDRYSEDKSLMVMYEAIRKDCLSQRGVLTVFCKLYKEKDKAISDASLQTDAISRTDTLADHLQELLLSGDNSDVTIRVKGQDFMVHRAILGARTPVFASMFRHQMTEKTSGIVNIDDCEADIFNTFLHYLYTGSVEKLSAENVFGLYKVAHKYQVDELKMYCVSFVKTMLSIETFCDVFALSVNYSEQELREKVIDFLSQNMKEVISTTKWQDFVSDNPIECNLLLLDALKLQK